MRDLLMEGIKFFNHGRYFAAHERWEDLWRLGDEGDRSYHQGLVQIAVGLHHLSTDNLRGGHRVLQRGLEKIMRHSPARSTIDNTQLINDLREYLQEAPGAIGPPQIRILPQR